MSAVLWKGFLDLDVHTPATAEMIGNTKALGIEIFTNYLFAFEIAAAILFLAIVAAVALTLRRRKDSKYVNPADAVKVKRNDRVRIVSMKAESDRANAVTTTENTGA
jgi:NADH-quinone oxidoreductase subunit J